MELNRRTLIGMIGVSGITLSGCLGSGNSVGGGGEGNENYPTVSVQADEAQQEDISMDAKLTRNLTEYNSARINISFTNNSDSEIQFTFGASPPFSQYISQNTSLPRLVIIPENNNSHIATDANKTKVNGSSTERNLLPPETKINDCWQIVGDLAVFTGAIEKTIAASETVSEDYVVLNYSGNQQCLPPNDYRFVAKNYFGKNKSWGFDIIIRE